MTLPVKHYGDSILRQKGKQVTEFSSELTALYEDMLVTMREEEGIGLAAQQVGIALQFCVVEVPSLSELPDKCILDGKNLAPPLIMPMCLANPIIEFLPGDEYYYEEGCLSFPEIKGEIARPELIIVRYQDLDGNKHQLECDGLLARCIQHEVDHLNGILFIDHMEKEIFTEIKKDVNALKKHTQSTTKKQK
ncbi:MAG: peptide deformylase [Opitutales bacterium]|jgi:peptide deformylase